MHVFPNGSDPFIGDLARVPRVLRPIHEFFGRVTELSFLGADSFFLIPRRLFFYFCSPAGERFSTHTKNLSRCICERKQFEKSKNVLFFQVGKVALDLGAALNLNQSNFVGNSKPEAVFLAAGGGSSLAPRAPSASSRRLFCWLSNSCGFSPSIGKAKPAVPLMASPRMKK
jgi:hypothetical protein